MKFDFLYSEDKDSCDDFNHSYMILDKNRGSEGEITNNEDGIGYSRKNEGLTSHLSALFNKALAVGILTGCVLACDHKKVVPAGPNTSGYHFNNSNNVLIVDFNNVEQSFQVTGSCFDSNNTLLGNLSANVQKSANGPATHVFIKVPEGTAKCFIFLPNSEDPIVLNNEPPDEFDLGLEPPPKQ